MCESMNPEPMIVAAANSVESPGSRNGMSTPQSSRPFPQSRGTRGPTRSMRRPASTDSSIGSSA